MATDDGYAAALSAGREIYPGMRIGRPGRARTYWPTIALMRLLRLRWAVSVSGSENVAAGSAILVGNHVSAMDPVAAVVTHWWRVTAFTKAEVFARRGAVFFRLMGQIPLRRGDEEATGWAMGMAAMTLARGGKLGLYPEGTRSPDHRTLHRLHQRILIPVITSNPDIPVHAITTTYPGRRRGRIRVVVRISPRLAIDPRTMDADQITEVIRATLVDVGGLDYIDVHARDVKAGMTPAAPA